MAGWGIWTDPLGDMRKVDKYCNTCPGALASDQPRNCSLELHRILGGKMMMMMMMMMMMVMVRCGEAYNCQTTRLWQKRRGIGGSNKRLELILDAVVVWVFTTTKAPLFTNLCSFYGPPSPGACGRCCAQPRGSSACEDRSVQVRPVCCVFLSLGGGSGLAYLRDSR